MLRCRGRPPGSRKRHVRAVRPGCPGRAYSDPNHAARSVIVERTLAWLNRCRGLASDREKFNRTALALLILATIRIMLR
ncbi:MAG: transposase [Methylocella sp.]